MKRAFAIASSLVLITGYSVKSSADGALRFFAGSADDCTEALARRGACKPGALSRCITVENTEGQDLVCKVVAKAALRSGATTDNGLSTNVFDISKNSKTSVKCFDFSPEAPARATFGYFTGFHGHCQSGTAASDPDFECDPETERCTFFQIDRTTCQPGWACHKIYIGKTITKTICTAELVESGVCEAGDRRPYACASVMNKGIAPLKCDLRLNVKRGSNAQPNSVVFRSRLLTGGAMADLCFVAEGSARAGRIGDLTANAVCRQMDFSGSLRAICDVERSSCEGESKVIEYVP